MSVPESEPVAVDNRQADRKREPKRKRGEAEKEQRDRKKKQKQDEDAQDGGNKERKPKRSKIHRQEEDTQPDLIHSREVDHHDNGKKGKEKIHSELKKTGKRNKDKKATPESSQGATMGTEVSPPENVEAVAIVVSKREENPGITNSDLTPRKRKKKQQVIDDYTEPGPEVTKTSKRNKEVAAIDSVAKGSAVTPATVQAHESKLHKSKKRKHDKINEAHMDTESSTSHKKKKRASHKHSEFPDPSEDIILSDSARNALSYVHARVSSQPDWKFNKARQNWVLRNLWDDIAVPEKYFSSCLKYLVGVQGNTRKLLIQAGAEFIESSSDPKGNVNPGDASGLDTDSNVAGNESPEEKERKRMLKKARAQTLLAALQASEESAS